MINISCVQYEIGSKKRVKWLFGFTGSEKEQEVILVHSLVTGKKVTLFRYYNGYEVLIVLLFKQ